MQTVLCETQNNPQEWEAACGQTPLKQPPGQMPDGSRHITMKDRAGRKTPALSFMAICLKNHPVPAHPALRQIRSMVSAVMVGAFLVVGRGDRDCCVIYIVFFHIYLWLVFLFCRFFRGFFLLVFPD